MEIILKFFDFILHVDRYIEVILQNYGTLAYIILFLIIFCETGLIITPFLPGDSLIFITGTFAAQGDLDVFLLFFLLSSASILGDTVNYWIGSYFGEKVFSKTIFFKKKYLEKTKDFYDKYGGKTIVLARFVPIVRTFAPFIAGVGKMDYVTFLGYNVFGGMLWVAIFVFGGYYLGSIEFIKENLALVTYIIVIISLIPPFIEYMRNKK